MAKKKSTSGRIKSVKKSNNDIAAQGSGEPALDYRHDAPRKNIPTAGLAAQGKVQQVPKLQYAYNPHLPPQLRFDATGKPDALPELLRIARSRALSDDEAQELAAALRNREPWLEWAGKRELPGFAVEPVALHIHERISAQAIVKVAARLDVERDLFADPELSYKEAVQFYQHDVEWSNRMILGDSLQVMASLARREGLAGKVQMVYLDPPYGIKFASNFQPEIRNRDVKDKESDLTREPEMVKAYRDTWTLGVHSYLTYLRDRLLLVRDLLADTGSIFVQISDENIHRVRSVMDEVFHSENFVSLITVKKTGGMGEARLDNISDYLLWYAKSIESMKYNPLYVPKELSEGTGARFARIELLGGLSRPITDDEQAEPDRLPKDARPWRGDPLTSETASDSTTFDFELHGHVISRPKKGGWKTNKAGMDRLKKAERLLKTREFVNLIKYLDDFAASSLGNLWADTMGTAEQDKIYVVQTTTKVIQRCLLMTTDPGDLVLDPTCGSGTTAYVSEQWGRRWITIDSSRVALALARQRLMTSRFEYYRLRPLNEEDLYRNPLGTWLRDPQKQVDGLVTLDCKTVPHVTLKSIARNTALDAIFEKHQLILNHKLKALNAAFSKVKQELKQSLAVKLAEKQKREGKRSITESDRRRWLMPPSNRDANVELTVDRDYKGWYEWEVPFETDPDWPRDLQDALVAYRTAWRAKMDEMNAAIAANADNEELVDDPKKVTGIVRVSGPFTMEAVVPPELRLDEESPIGGAPEELETFDTGNESVNAEAHLDKILRLLRADGVQFPNNKVVRFTRLDARPGEFLHAEGEWASEKGEIRKVAVSVGPEHGAVTAYQVENAIRQAHRRGVDELVFAGFSFDAMAQAAIQGTENSEVQCHLAHIRPDVNMTGLLKETPNSQLFTVFGLPRTALTKLKDEQYQVTMEGVDVYNPVENSLMPTSADKVAAWFLDSDYDGRTFCVTQAFFPDKSAWDKLAKALKGVVDEERFAAFSGTKSLPFPAGQNKRVAVKVIDPRGNEVMRVHRLDVSGGY